MNRKIILIRNICILLCVLLIGRIFFIQFVQNTKLTKQAAQQKINDYIIKKVRGDFFDKNMIPLTNRDKNYRVVLDDAAKSESIPVVLSNMKSISHLSNLSIFEADKKTVETLQNMYSGNINIIIGLKRYSIDTVAKHIIGYLNESDYSGRAGLEWYYDKVLDGNNAISIGTIRDFSKQASKESDKRVFELNDESKKLNLKLTIDYRIQRIVEEVMDKNISNGAVVVEDICTGDIIAICSRPEYDQNMVEKYIISDKQELLNKAVAEFDAGSVFKIIVAAAALEAGIEDFSIECKGIVNIGDVGIKCHSYSTGGHGIVTLDEAFSLSCNSYFINLGAKVGVSKIINMSKKFGLGAQTQISKQGVDEASGKLPDDNLQYYDGDVANWSIGQGGIMITPVQAAHLSSIIANGGINNSINLVDGIISDKGEMVRRISNSYGERVISKKTADRLKEMMYKTISEGTAKKCNLDSVGGAGGKTGSAETGIVIEGEDVVHAWFTGFYPYETPKYAISVFVENGKSGGGNAAPIFEKLVKQIEETY